MFFFTPRYLKVGRQFIKDARKLVAFKRDLVAPEVVADVEREIVHLEHAVAGRDRPTVEAQMQRLDQACGTLTQPQPDAAWRENVEVFLVAIVIALAVRTYFLQPFTIPTGSMQPTLNGILSHKTTESSPNPLVQVAHLALLGRNYVDIVARTDEEVVSVAEESRGGLFRWLTFTRIDTTANNVYWIWGAHKNAEELLTAELGHRYKAGEPIARGYINTGDHVFVDKVSYQVVRPTNGEVFVFSTHGIERMRQDGPTQYYIKRLAGLPNDTLRIDAPELYINGSLARQFGFQRVMTGKRSSPPEGYRGYGNGAEYKGVLSPMTFLKTPEETFEVPPDAYFALGDNSYNSSDSRYWGLVPQQNVMGRAVWVYWPFTSHWGLIR